MKLKSVSASKNFRFIKDFCVNFKTHFRRFAPERSFIDWRFCISVSPNIAFARTKCFHFSGMNAPNFASLVNLLGFAVGVALYAMLLVMARRGRENSAAKIDYLLVATAILGLLWNAGELLNIGIVDFGKVELSPVWLAISFSALGFLPAVVVHSVLQKPENKKSLWLIFAAYALSSAASLLHFREAFFSDAAPSRAALYVLIAGFLCVLIVLFSLNFRQTAQRKAVWAIPLTIFAVSALHLTMHTDASAGNWLVEFVGHQASLPLALAILYEDYRFAFADLFLKRALSFFLLTLTAFAIYVFVASPLLSLHETHGKFDATAIATLLALWIATALIYPSLHAASVLFVDKILLLRADYKILQKQIARDIEDVKDTDSVLNAVAEKLGSALTAKRAGWEENLSQSHGGAEIFTKDSLPVEFSAQSVEVAIPTAEPPFYRINLRDLSGGRRLLSDEMEMLENVALLAARRIDVLRVTDERYEREIREREFSRLTTQAELRALRAQLNPHFLFNALTTISYLIKASPDKANETLLYLTKLLRGVLRSTGEFSTLGDELKLIESYLEIERARFEERLRVEIWVSPEFHRLKIPSLILQPLVENAVKHGISNKIKGGNVKISARVENQNLILEVADTGAGASPEKILENRKNGVGLSNVEQRLRSHFGASARLEIESASGIGATSRIVFPVSAVK